HLHEQGSVVPRLRRPGAAKLPRRHGGDAAAAWLEGCGVLALIAAYYEFAQDVREPPFKRLAARVLERVLPRSAIVCAGNEASLGELSSRFSCRQFRRRPQARGACPHLATFAREARCVSRDRHPCRGWALRFDFERGDPWCRVAARHWPAVRGRLAAEDRRAARALSRRDPRTQSVRQIAQLSRITRNRAGAAA